MKSSNSLILTGLSLLATAGIAHAHPGHDLFEHGTAHAMTSPIHLAVIAGLGFSVFALASLVKDNRHRALARYSGAITAIAALALWVIG